jgi:Tfp pilus assembly protein PilN
MKLTGAARNDLQVAQFISTLAKSSLFQDVNLIVSEEADHDGQLVRRFQLDIKLDAAASVDPTKSQPSAALR